MEGVLYAQAIPNGYQLVDSAPKIQMRLLTTSVQGIYLVERGDIQGILFNKDGHWIFEYYEGDGLRAEELAIKF